MKTTLLCITAILFGLSAHAQLQPQPQPSKNADAKFPASFASSKLTYKIIDAPGTTYCYDIYADGRLMIHQSSAPALPGNESLRPKPMQKK